MPALVEEEILSNPETPPDVVTPPPEELKAQAEYEGPLVGEHYRGNIISTFENGSLVIRMDEADKTGMSRASRTLIGEITDPQGQGFQILLIPIGFSVHDQEIIDKVKETVDDVDRTVKDSEAKAKKEEKADEEKVEEKAAEGEAAAGEGS
jgi:hypothetical protein